MALAAACLEAIEQNPRRLHWWVDLDHDPQIGTEYNAADPSADGPGVWEDMLRRFRAYLDRQPHWPDTGGRHKATWDTRAEIALTINHTLMAHGQRVQTTFQLMWSAQCTVLCGKPPPAGIWVLWPQPQRKDRSMMREGDMNPSGEAWIDAIPF